MALVILSPLLPAQPRRQSARGCQSTRQFVAGACRPEFLEYSVCGPHGRLRPYIPLDSKSCYHHPASSRQPDARVSGSRFRRETPSLAPGPWLSCFVAEEGGERHANTAGHRRLVCIISFCRRARNLFDSVEARGLLVLPDVHPAPETH